MKTQPMALVLLTSLSPMLVACAGDDGDATTQDGDSAADASDSSGPTTDDGATSGAGTSGDGTGGSDEAGDGQTETGSSDQGGTTDASTSGATTRGETGVSDGTTGQVEPDPCSGLDQRECYAQNQLGICQPIWGVPYFQPPNGGGEWCLFPNGTEYLGCAVADGCQQTETTVCQDEPYAAWQVTWTCLPADLDVGACEAPGDCIY